MYLVYKEEGLYLRSKQPRRNKSASQRINRPELTTINECSSMDFVADQLIDGRKCIEIYPNQSIKGQDVVNVLDHLKYDQKILPKRIQVGNRSEFISKVLDKWAYENNVFLDFSRSGKPTDNPFIESFNGSLRDECLNATWFLSLKDTRRKIKGWKDEYNSFRPHSSLNNLTPDQVYQEQLDKTDFSNIHREG